MDVATFDTGLLHATIERALRRGGDFAEVFVEVRDSFGLRLEDGRIEHDERRSRDRRRRALLSGERTFYAYSDEIGESGLARRRGRRGRGDERRRRRRPRSSTSAPVAQDPVRHPVRDPAGDGRHREEGRSCAPATRRPGRRRGRSRQAIVGYGDTRQQVLIANSLGDLVR